MEDDCATKYLEKLSNNMNAFRQLNVLCDTTLITSDRELKAHSVVLAAASPVFQSALHDCPRAANSGYQLEVLGMDGLAMEVILDLIYAGTEALQTAGYCCTVDINAIIILCEELGLEWLKAEFSKNSHSIISTGLVNSVDENIDIETLLADFDGHIVPDEGTAVTKNEIVIDSFSQPEDSHRMPDKSTAFMKKEIVSDSFSQPEDTLVMSIAIYVCDICDAQFGDAVVFRHHRSQHRDCAFCPDCGHCFESLPMLQLHRSAQCSAKQTTCNLCTLPCIGIPQLARHVANKHIDSYRCADCQQPFANGSALRLHRKLQHRREPFCFCHLCGLSFCSQRQLKMHSMTTHRPATAAMDSSCNICQKLFDSESHLAEHLKNAHQFSDTVLCSECGMSFVAAIKFHAHMQTHLAATGDRHRTNSSGGSGRHICVDCGRTFTHPSNLTNHRRSHADDRRFVCTICGRAFKDNCLERHMLLVHERGARPFACTDCPRTFARTADLHAHQQCHTGEMQHRCTICGRLFRKRNTLSRHMRVHTGERPYVCETCGKSFKILFHLRMHTGTHSTDRPHVCTTCGKAFGSALRLRKHAVVHSGVKPYGCPVCGRHFNRSSNMRAHMRVHQVRTDSACSGSSVVTSAPIFAGEYECAYCQVKLETFDALHIHLRAHSDEFENSVMDAVPTDGGVESCSAVEVMYCQMDDESDTTYIALPVLQL